MDCLLSGCYAAKRTLAAGSGSAASDPKQTSRAYESWPVSMWLIALTSPTDPHPSRLLSILTCKLQEGLKVSERDELEIQPSECLDRSNTDSYAARAADRALVKAQQLVDPHLASKSL